MESIVDLQTELICQYDKDIKLTYVNRAYSEWLGTSKEQLIGTSILDRIPAEERSHAITHVKSLTIEQPVAVSIHHSLMDDGSRVTIEWTDRALFDDTGNLTGFLGVGRDVTAREQKDRQIKTLQNQFTSVLESIQDAIMAISLPDRQLIYISDSFEKVYGYTIESIKNNPDFYKKVVHPEDMEQAIQAMATCRREGHAELDHRIIWPDGQVRWIHHRSRVNYDANGQPFTLTDTAHDITDRKQVALALQNSEQTLRLFVEHAPASITMFDREMRYLAVSRRWLIENDLDGQNLIGRCHYDIVPEIPERWREIHRRCLAGTVEKCEADPFPRANGTTDWVRWEAHPWRDSRGEIGGILLFSEIITNQKAAEDALRRSEVRYRQLFEVNGLPKLLVDPINGQIVDANPAAAEFYGYDLPTLKTLNLSAINHIPPEKTKEKMADLIDNRLTTLHTKNHRANGDIVDVEVYTGPVDYDGRTLLYATITDVTEREKAKVALEEANNHLERRVAERTAELETTKNRLEAIFNHSGDAILLLDIQEGIQQANPTFEQLFASQPEEYLRKDLSTVLQSENSAEIAAVIQKVATTHQKQQIEARTLTGLDVEISLAPVNRFTKTVASLVCIIRDITERKRVEASLQKYATEVEYLYNNSPAGYHSLAKDGTVVKVNDTELGWLGYSREEIIGKVKAIDLLTPESQEKFKRSFAQMHEKGEIKNEELELIHKNGSILPVIVNATATYDEQGNFLYTNSSLTDNTELKKAKQALAEERNLLRTVIDTVPDFIYMVDTRHHIVLNNLSHAWSLGVNSPAEAVGKSYDRFFPTPMVAKFNADDARVMQSGLPVLNTEERSLGQDRNEIWALTTKIPFRNLDGEITGLIGITRDITERKKAEEALRESEARYRLLAENITDVVMRTRAGGTIIFVTSSCHNLLGYRPEELQGRNTSSIIHPDDWEAEQQVFMDALAKRDSSYRLRQRFTHKDGYYVKIEVNNTIVYDPVSGEFIETVSVVRDISKRTKAEEALRESEARYRLLAENVTDVILRTEAGGNIWFVTPSCYNLLGYRPEELVGQNTASLIHPDDYTPGREIFQKALQTREPSYRFILHLRHRDGHYLPTEIINTLIYEPETGAYTETISVLRDFTERQKAEDALRLALEREKELGELKTRFVSMASHEFRTPLASILATTESLANYRERMDKSQIDGRLDKIRMQVLHLKEIMDDVLQQARMQAGRVEIRPVPGSLDKFCRDIIEEFETQPRNHGRIIYRYPDSNIMAIYDIHLMRQIISNLISNALKYSTAEKPVLITLTQDDAGVVIQVQDQGIGIPPEDLKHLFEPFYRATNVGTISGTGLGLNITRQAIELHGGTIKAESKIGIGTTFTVKIPQV